MIKNPNERLYTIKLPQENIDKALFAINHRNVFLDLSPRVM